MWIEARYWIDRARAIYSEIRGHDLLGNGPAHCQHTYGSILLYSEGRPEGATDAASAEAAQAARAGLAMLDDVTSPKLHGMLANLTAVSLKSSSRRSELLKAREAIETAMYLLCAELEMNWSAGFFEAKLGNVEAGVEYFSAALDAAREHRMEPHAGAIVADIGLVFPNPREVRSQIEGLVLDEELAALNPNDESAEPFPRWFCQSLDGRLRAVWHAALAERVRLITATARRLRAEAVRVAASSRRSRQLMPAAI